MKDLRLVIEELDRHKERLLYSKRKIESWGELNVSVLNIPDKVEIVDSFIFRFCKMQDSMGEKLFPLILEFLGEEVRNKPFIDILNRLEELEVLESADVWKRIREIRNFLVHLYPWETEEMIDNIRVSLSYSEKLIEIYESFKAFIRRRNLLK